MNPTILVAYATRYGSTQEVAEVIAAVLRDHGLAVTLQPMADVQTLEGFGAVVLGAPLYIGHWHKHALAFLAQHGDALANLPVAMFALGPTMSGDAQEWQGARACLEQELAKFPRLTPIAQAMFGGKYDPAKLSVSHKLLAALPASPLHGLPASDLRDWAAIAAWASELAEKLEASVKEVAR